MHTLLELRNVHALLLLMHTLLRNLHVWYITFIYSPNYLTHKL